MTAHAIIVWAVIGHDGRHNILTSTIKTQIFTYLHFKEIEFLYLKITSEISKFELHFFIQKIIILTLEKLF